MIPCSIRSIIKGLSPTFITCAPIAAMTIFLLLHADAISDAISFRSFTARISGRFFIKSLRVLPALYGFAKSLMFTLLFLDLIEYVISFFEDKGRNFIIIAASLSIFIFYASSNKETLKNAQVQERI